MPATTSILTPPMTSASARVHGPWQITPIGLPVSANALRTDRVGVHPQFVRVDGSARHQQRVVIIGGHVGDHAVDRGASADSMLELPGLNLAGMQRDDLGRGSRTV